MAEPGFWDDQERAARVSTEHAAADRRLSTFRSLESEADDLEQLEELAADDESIADELATQRASFEARLAELEEARLFSGEYDRGDAVVSIHAGTGGTDSQDWAEMLLRMEMRWAERRGMQVELKEASPGEEAGIKSATFVARGENAYGLFSAEKGVHRLVRISPFDASSRRHTSFALVEVAPLVDEAVDVQIDESDLQIDTYRASGAGGQHVNKTDSAVRITHRPTGIVVQCQNERSQSSNRTTAMQMLRSKLVERAEQQRREELAREKGEAQDVGWGSQIRSYVLHPYTMVKDHRTGARDGRRAARARRRPRRVRPRRAAAAGRDGCGCCRGVARLRSSSRWRRRFSPRRLRRRPCPARPPATSSRRATTGTSASTGSRCIRARPRSSGASAVAITCTPTSDRAPMTVGRSASRTRPSAAASDASRCRSSTAPSPTQAPTRSRRTPRSRAAGTRTATGT